MRIIPILTAVFVVSALYLLVFERDSVLNFAQTSSPTAPDTAPDADETAQADTQDDATDDTPDLVRVVAMASKAQDIDSAVILRGRTEAARDVQVAAETSGLVISEPISKGNYVDAGDVLCRLAPGTREARLAEARARLAEANGRVPEAQAAIAEAQARLREANLNVENTRRLNERGVASETQLFNAEAVAEAALAGLQRAQSGTASAFVPEIDKDKVQLGAMAGAKLTSGAEVRGAVKFISRSADETTRTFRVEVEVPNDDLRISAGQTVEIVVAAFMPVTLLRDTTEGVWLTGLPDVVNIITVGQEYVVDGVTVAPTFQEAKG